MRRRKIVAGLACGAVSALLVGWMARGGARVHTIEPGKIVRGPWQSPPELRSLVERLGIRTIVTLTAINVDDPKYVAQQRVVDDMDVFWKIIPMRGSTATLEQLDEAVDSISDTARQPVFFHCVGGHHRSNLVHAAYRIRHDGRSTTEAWAEICSLPWTHPVAARDQQDRRLIEEYGRRYGR